MDNLNELLATACDAARRAGQIILAAFSTSSSDVEYKAESTADMVTKSDKECEATIIELLSTKYPSSLFIAEETQTDNELTDAPTWIIDPIDGTTNFIHRYPHSSVSIGFAVNKELTLSVVYNPMRSELFTAIRGRGAFLNGFPISCNRSITSVAQALVSTNFGNLHRQSVENMDYCVRRLRNLMSARCHGVRMLGGAALQLCDVACGRADVYYEEGIKPWDVAAGALIVLEAGGVVEDSNGGKFDVMANRIIVAGSQQLMDDAQRILKL